MILFLSSGMTILNDLRNNSENLLLRFNALVDE